jgi:hypothetical protein
MLVIIFAESPSLPNILSCLAYGNVGKITVILFAQDIFAAFISDNVAKRLSFTEYPFSLFETS